MKKLKKHTTLRISACLIVKNEAAHLADCLRSLADFVSEIVVIDTGSQDNTLAIARQFTKKAFTFPWTDDFSAPRNFALSQASQDWILHVDADERWSKESFRALFESPELQRPSKLPIVVYCNYVSTHEVLLKRTLHQRGFFHFKGFVHEYLYSETPYQRIDLPEVHIQNVSQTIKDPGKHLYYEQLILKSLIEESPTEGRKMELYWHLYLSRQVSGGNAQEALQAALKQLQIKGLEYTHFDYVLFMTALFSRPLSSDLLLLKGQIFEACALFKTAACWFFGACFTLYQEPSTQQKQHLENYLQKLKATYDSSEVFVPHLSDCALLWSRYCVQQGRFSEALLHARKSFALKTDLYTQSYLAFLIQMQEGPKALNHWLHQQKVTPGEQNKLWSRLYTQNFFNSNEKFLLKKPK